MRIPCTYCGNRQLDEFTYFGDATVRRPDAEAADAPPAFVSYVYDRTNPTGPHRELWYHGLGCRQWLVVTRDITTHEVLGAEPAREVSSRSAAVSARPAEAPAS